MALALGFLGNRWGMLIVAMLAAYLYGFYSVEMPDIAAIERNAIVGRDAHWQSKLAEQERKSHAELAAAIEARDATPPIPDVPDWAERLCRESSTCRDNRRSK